MSYDATNWAIKQRGMEPTTKIVLWQLCDRFHPDHGCFLNQHTLAADCELSRATVNRHLDKLEQMGLIRREKRRDEATNRQRSTRYRFAFEADFHLQSEAEPCPDMRHGSVSQKTQKPCLKNSESRVSNCDTNLVIEPVREPVTNAGAREVSDFDVFWERYPHKVARVAAKRAFEKALAKVELNDLLAAVDRYRTSKPPERQWLNPSRWLDDERWSDEPASIGGRKDNLLDHLNRRFPRSDWAEDRQGGVVIDGELVEASGPRRPRMPPTAFQRRNPHLYPELFSDAATGGEAQR